MTPLRAKMIEAMTVRGFSVRTHRSYLSAVRDLARHYQEGPERLTLDDLRSYFVYLAVERGLSGASCRLYLNAIRFLYLQVLKWPRFDVAIPMPKVVQRIPELLSHAEVAAILAACANAKHRMMLTTCYGCGLRVSELVALQVRDIDSERRLLRTVQGKGAKDRLVPLGPTLLGQLRGYWQLYRPSQWLFPGRSPAAALGVSSIQKAFTQAKARAGVGKIGGIHSLRHAYATHQLEAGLPVHLLQYQLGHSNIQSTLRYVHWAPSARQGKDTVDDLVLGLAVDHD
jgi:integrase